MWIKWLKKARPESLVVILILAAILMSCEEYQEGCMDATATNFRVSNQVPCCCEYPVLVFQTTFTKDSVTRSFADTFTNSFGQQYLIRDFRFIATGVTLSDSLDQIYTLTDTFDQYKISPGILAVDVLNLDNKGSNFMWDGRFDGLQFSIDYPEELQSRRPEDFPMDHPLRDSMFYDLNRSAWVAARVVIDLPDQDLITIELTGNDLPVPVLLRGDWTKRRGNNLTVNFKINIETLFGEMDFSSPPSELIATFASNLPASIEP